MTQKVELQITPAGSQLVFESELFETIIFKKDLPAKIKMVFQMHMERLDISFSILMSKDELHEMHNQLLSLKPKNKS